MNRETVIQVAIVAVVIAVVAFAISRINKGRAMVAGTTPNERFIADEEGEDASPDERLAGFLPSIVLNKIRNRVVLTQSELALVNSKVKDVVKGPLPGELRKICCRSGDGVNITVSLISHIFGQGCEKAKGACSALMS